MGAIAGACLAGLAALWVFYDRTGTDVVDRLYTIAGHERVDRPNQRNKGWYGYEAERPGGTDAHGEGNEARSREGKAPAEPLAADWGGVVSPTNPMWLVRRGYDVLRVADGFTYPVNIAFVLDPKEGAEDPLYYVNELHGTIKYVARNGEVHTYATKLNNFRPIAQPKSDETGLSGLMTLPGSEDLLATGSYLDEESGLLSNHLLRLRSRPGGRKLDRVDVLFDLEEFTAPSNQIQQVRLGPDQKLYVSVGDAENHRLSLDLDKFGGKILRLNRDGSACSDNPFYDPAHPRAPRSYIFAYGFRNVFDFDFEPVSGRLFAADNGKAVDRLIAVVRGGNYGWNGDDMSMRTNAILSWGPPGNPAPVGLTFPRRETAFAGHEVVRPAIASRVADPKPLASMFLALYGPAHRAGRNHAKSIVVIAVNPENGMVERSPEPLIQYVGEGVTTVLGLAEGPDGLYFTDFFGESAGGDDPAGKGAVWKVVRSEATRNQVAARDAMLVEMTPLERGQVRFSRNCATCHRVAGVGGHEGPELTHAAHELDRRLHSQAYVASARQLLKSKNAFLVEQHGRIKEVLDAEGTERVTAWLQHHLEEPRFDNTYAKMPSFALLPPDERKEIIDYVQSLK